MRVSGRFWIPLVIAAALASGPSAPASFPSREQAQAELIAAIGEQLDACRNLIREGQRYQEALDLLSPLTARVFTVADRNRQMGLAVEIFLLKGIAQSGLGNEPAAVIEFRSMFAIDPALARETTKNIYDPKLTALLRQAEEERSKYEIRPRP